MSKELQNKKIGLRRLQKLSDLLRTVPRSHFDYTSFCRLTNSSYSDEYFQKITAKNKCCTQACALGWATSIFRDLRLSQGQVVNVKTSKVDFEAASEFFNITLDESTSLFAPNYEVGDIKVCRQDEDLATPKQVAQKISRFISLKTKELGIQL